MDTSTDEISLHVFTNLLKRVPKDLRLRAIQNLVNQLPRERVVGLRPQEIQKPLMNASGVA